MKYWTKRLVAVVMVLALTNISVWAANTTYGAKGALQEEAYTLEEMLQYALQDERMAQAEYEAIMTTLDVEQPFSHILEAEKRHEQAIIDVYEAKGIEIPEFDAATYVTIPETLEEAYQVGIQAEKDNIAMYDAFLAQDLDEDVQMTFEALKRASEFHLRAFSRGAGEDIDGTAFKRGGPGFGQGDGTYNRGLGGCRAGSGRDGAWNMGGNRRIGNGLYADNCPLNTYDEE